MKESLIQDITDWCKKHKTWTYEGQLIGEGATEVETLSPEQIVSF